MVDVVDKVLDVVEPGGVLELVVLELLVVELVVLELGVLDVVVDELVVLELVVLELVVLELLVLELVVLELVVEELVVLELEVDELLVVEPVVVDPEVVVSAGEPSVDEVGAAGLVLVGALDVPVVVDAAELLAAATNGPVTVMPTWTWPIMPPRPGVSASTWRRPSMSMAKFRSWFWPSSTVTLPLVGIQLS